MKIAIIGAGALGTLLAGRLAGTGHEIWLLHHNEEYVTAIDESGVCIESENGDVHETHIRTTADAAAVGPATHVLSLQNGLTNHYRLREHVGTDRVLSGVSYQGATLERSEKVVHTADGPLVFGGRDTVFAE